MTTFVCIFHSLLLCLLTASLAEKVFLCPSADPGSITLHDIGVHIQVFALSAEPPTLPQCVDASGTEEHSLAFVVRKHRSFSEHADAALALEQHEINCLADRVPSFIPSVESQYVLLHCAPDALERLQSILYTHTFQALKAVRKQPAQAQKPTVTMTKQETKDNFVTGTQLNSQRFTTIMNDLTGRGTLNISTRCTYSAQHNTAANYILDWFSNLGYSSSLQPFTFSRYATNNILAIKPGTTHPDEVVVVGGHYDSTSNRCSTDAPGAVDNAGGCTMVMLLAQAAVSVQFDRTVHFVCFGGEEQGLYGSYHYVDISSDNVVAALLADMISYSSKFYGVTFEGTNDPDILRLMDIAKENAHTYAPKLQAEISTNSFGSDHVPFQSAGIPAFLFIELDDTDYPCYHQTCDTMEYVNTDQSMDIIAVAAGTLWDAAFRLF